jgi:hypothetical protein
MRGQQRNCCNQVLLRRPLTFWDEARWAMIRSYLFLGFRTGVYWPNWPNWFIRFNWGTITMMY